MFTLYYITWLYRYDLTFGVRYHPCIQSFIQYQKNHYYVIQYNKIQYHIEKCNIMQYNKKEDKSRQIINYNIQNTKYK